MSENLKKPIQRAGARFARGSVDNLSQLRSDLNVKVPKADNLNELPKKLQTLITERKFGEAVVYAKENFEKAKNPETKLKWQNYLRQVESKVKDEAKKQGKTRGQLLKTRVKDKTKQRKQKQELTPKQKKKKRRALIAQGIAKVKGTRQHPLNRGAGQRQKESKDKTQTQGDKVKNRIINRIPNKVQKWGARNAARLMTSLKERELGRWVEESRKLNYELGEKNANVINNLFKLSALSKGKIDINTMASERFDLSKMNVIQQDKDNTLYDFDDSFVLDVANSALGKAKHIAIKKLPESIRPDIVEEGLDYLKLEKLDYGKPKGLKAKIKRKAKDTILDAFRSTVREGASEVVEQFKDETVGDLIKPIKARLQESNAFDVKYGQQISALVEHLSASDFTVDDISSLLGEENFGFTEKGLLKIGNPSSLLKKGIKSVAEMSLTDDEKESLEKFRDNQIFLYENLVDESLDAVFEQLESDAESGESKFDLDKFENLPNILSDAINTGDLSQATELLDWFKESFPSETQAVMDLAQQTLPAFFEKSNQTEDGKIIDYIYMRNYLEKATIKEINTYIMVFLDENISSKQIKNEIISLKLIEKKIKEQDYKKAFYLQDHLNLVKLQFVDEIIKNNIAENIEIYNSNKLMKQTIIKSYEEMFGTEIVKKAI